MLYLHHGNNETSFMEIKKQTQVFITVPHNFYMQIQKETAGIITDIG